MRHTILKVVLIWQGFYYIVTSLWAFISLEHFTRVTNRPVGDPFEAHTNAAIFLILGIAFLFGVVREKNILLSGWLALCAALAVLVPEIIYFQEIRHTLFLFDMWEEVFVATVASIGLARGWEIFAEDRLESLFRLYRKKGVRRPFTDK